MSPNSSVRMPMTFNRAHAMRRCLAALAAIGTLTAAHPRAQQQSNNDQDEQESQIRHVLLISIDGMHALDFENCVADGTCPHLARLGDTGVTYTRTSTSKPSDSFPGL